MFYTLKKGLTTLFNNTEYEVKKWRPDTHQGKVKMSEEIIWTPEIVLFKIAQVWDVVAAAIKKIKKLLMTKVKKDLTEYLEDDFFYGCRHYIPYLYKFEQND